MATVFERWSQTLDELKARKAKPQEVESARSELRRKFEEKAKESGLDDAARAVALTRFETGTQALSVKKGLVKEPDILSDEERFAVNHPVIGGIMQAGKELVAPLAQGTQRIVGGAARLLNDIGDNDKGTVLDQIATSMDDAQKSVDEFAGEGYAKADGVRGFAKSAVQNVPQLALSFIPGAALGKAASLAQAAKGAQASANVLKYGKPIAAGLSFGQNFAGEYGDARQQTEQKLAEATPEDLRNSKKYGDEFSKLERDFYDKGMSVDDAAVAARDYLVDSIAEKRANVVAPITTALEFIAPGAMAVMPGRKAAAAAKSLALAGKTAGGGRLGNKAANLSDLKDVGEQFLQEAAQGGVTERVAEGARANAFNDNVDYGSVAKSAMIEGLAGGIMGGGMQMAAGGTSRRLANDAVKDATSQRERYANAASQADAMAADIRASSAGREMTEDESAALVDAEMLAKNAKDMVAKIDAALGKPADTQSAPNDSQQPAMDELRAAADEYAPQPEPQPAPQPTPQPSPGLSGVVGRAQASAAPDITSTIDEHIAAGQTPDFTALAQSAKRDRSEVVDLFNRRRTLADMAEVGDLAGMRDMAGRMTSDPAEQDSLIEQAVAIRDKRRNLAAQAQQQPQQAVPQPVSDPQDPEQAKYAKTYQKALDDAVAALESGKSDVDAFLPLNRQYKGQLNDTDLSGLIDSAKQIVGQKVAAGRARDAAITAAMPHVAAGDEISAVAALADAGITDDAEVQAALKEAGGRVKQQAKQAQQPAQPPQPAQSPMEQAVAAVQQAEKAGKGVKLATIARKFGVKMADLAVTVARARTAALNTKQPEEKRPEVLALPAPSDAPIPADQPLVSRRGSVMPKAQADAMSEVSANEKRDMRRAMAEEAGNPTGVPTGLRPRVESPARAEQKAVLPDIILRNDGQPFPSEVDAKRVMKRKDAIDTHEIVPAPEGKGVIIKAKRKGPSTAIDVEKDDILAAIAKLGGVDWEQARAQGGFDPAESGRRGSGILRVFKRNGGMPLDRMAETLSQYGYPVTEGDGNYSVNALLDAMDAAMRGGKVGTPQFNERLAREAYEREAEMRALDDALDNTSSDMPSWLDDGADNMISAADESDTVVAAIADVLSEVENEQITGPVAGTGQETDAGAAPRGGEGSRAPAAEAGSRGQREGQADIGQGQEDAGQDKGNWIGADRYFEETLDNEYGPETSRSEAAVFSRTATPGTTILETIIRPSGKKVHLLHLVGADGDRQTEFVREGDTLDSVLPAMREKLKRSEESLAQMKEKSSREADANKEIAKRNGFVVGKRLGDITPNTGKLLRSAVIIADHGNGVFDVQGTAGNKQAVISGMTAASIERAVARANGEDSFSLTAQTEAERLAEERRQAAAVEAERKAEEQARQKAQADRDINSFTLTGSDRPADVAVAAGQNDLFGPKTRGEKEAERKDEERKQAEADKTHAEAVDAAKYLKDIVYSLENLIGDNKRLLASLSSKLGKSGRDSILMNALGITREQAHDINNRLDDRMPHKLRAVDMQDAYERFPALKRIIDDAEVEVRVSEEARKARGEHEGKRDSAPTAPAEYGNNNKLVKKDRAAEIRDRLKAKLNGSQLNSGFDPEILALGAELAAFHIEAGARKFLDFAKAIANDLGVSVKRLRPYLRGWFNGARDMIEDSGLPIEGMDGPDQVREALAAIDKEIAEDGGNSGAITPESLQDYVIERIRGTVGEKFPDGDSPLVVREVESTDFAINEILQAHPAVTGRRNDPATYKKFAEAAKLVDNGVIRKAIIGTREIIPFDPRQSRNTQEDQANARNTGGGSSGNSAKNETPRDQGVVLAEQRQTERSDGFAIQASGRDVEGDGKSGARVPGIRTADGGERGDQPVHNGHGQFQPTDDPAGTDERAGGAVSGDTRVPIDRAGSEAAVQAVEASSPEVTLRKKLAAQRQAEDIPVVVGDKENIDATLPFLLDGQREDVHTAEKRFAAKNGHGMLFTNGTGTGKTFLSLGVIKRFVRQGKGNILVVVPSDAVMREWQESAPALGLTVNPLTDTKDAGKGISITTYANFGQNDAIASRDYDLVVMDEAHNLMQNAQAEVTAALSALRAITGHEDGVRRLTDMQNREVVNGISSLSARIHDNLANLKGADNWRLRVETDRLDAELQEMRDKYEAAYEANKRKVLTSPRPKALFLSATPFAYEKNIAWAQGYLFDWNEGRPDENSRTRAYNEPSNYERFMIQHFGYRMRYNKLTEPDAKVDRDLMQREFNATLRKAGSLSARMLDVPSDYQRVFALTPSALGTKIDDGLTWLREAENGKFRLLYDVVAKRFDYLSRQRLLEAMKAEAVIPMIQKWHELGKKVVVFYDFNEGGGFQPFNLGNYQPDSDKGESVEDFAQLAQEFYAKRPDLLGINTSSLPSPLESLTSAFPNAGVYNGVQPKKKRAAAMEAFNDDNNKDANLLIVQSAANAGWSAHDKTGKFKRVLINLGLPTAPTKAIQQEGRIYRQGQHPESDSMFVYMNTGTSWERAAFAGTIARRASTAENLAMGEQARGLRDAFIMAFEDSEVIEPSLDEGKGSKEKDRALTKALSPFDRAKSYYFGQLKKTSATKAREGKDYFATPEPVGMKMVEWLNLEGGEKALEPSAGHGAISRWLPDNTENTIVEPSFELISRAALNTNAKQINGSFEDLNIVNKYHGIVMNPPFGVGGKTAIEHLDKAFRHLSDGGRIVALIPEGPAADKRFDEWMHGRDDKDKPLREDAVIRAVIRLPASTFERAGTNVRTRIVVIDRVRDEAQRRNMPSEMNIDLSSAGDINNLFSRIENIDIPARIKKEAADSSDLADAGTGSALLVPKETTHAIKKIPLFVATMSRRVDGDTFTAINRVAKRYGGYYSAFSKNKAIPGFQFESEQARKAFMDEVGDGSQYGAAGQPDGSPLYSTSPSASSPGLTIDRAREALAADPVLSKALPYIDIKNSTDEVPDGAEMMFLPAWHGSPYRFDKFSLDHMGKGEGNQAYGWGLYFAGNKAVAEFYRKALAFPDFDSIDVGVIFEAIKKRYYNSSYSASDLIDDIEYRDGQEGSGQPQESFDRMVLDDMLRDWWNDPDTYGRTLKIAEDVGAKQSGGQLYRVEIPEDDTYLLWDKPMSEQPQAFINAVMPIGLVKPGSDPYGGDIYEDMQSLVSKGIIPKTGKSSAESVSRWLFGKGVNGVRYLDGDSRASVGKKDSYNYVVFDENAVQIAETYYSAGSNNTAEGYYHNGRITLFADNIRATGSMSAEERLKWVAFHEITHRGIANLSDSETYLSELGRAAKHPFVKNLAKKIYEHRQTLDPKFHVSMEVATEEALAEINAALRTGNIRQIKEQYGLHFPLSIRPRVRSAVSRFFEAAKRIINRMFGRGLTDEQLEGLLGRVTEAGVGPGPSKKNGGSQYDAAVYSLASENGKEPTAAELAEAKRQIDEQLAIADRMIAERGGLFAPNGEPSKLSRYQWAQVRTANFKEWFGDWENDPANASKVVDANGEPMVVYHGTGSSFDAFDPAKGGSESGNDAGKKGYFLSGSTAIASDYALRAKGAANVMPAFLALPNPMRRKFRDIDQLDYWASINDFSGGLIADLGDGQQVFMVKDGNQIKSATGNAGTFSTKTDDIRYSTGPMDWLNEQGRIAKQYFSKETASLDLTFWQKTLGTQLNTALKNPAFKKVYDLTQRLIQHVNNDAYDSINAAPDVLGRLEDWKDYKRDLGNTAKEIGAAVTLRQSKRQKDMQAAAEVLFEGTRFDKKVYSEKELDGFGLTADQKEIYRQARAAIDKSVGNAGKSQAINVAMNAQAVNWQAMEKLINADMEPDALFAELRDLIDTRVADARNEISAGASPERQEALEKKIATWEQAATAVGEIEGIVNKSVTEGYAPLMRWGRYTVSVIDPATKKTLRFHMLESKREQAALTVKLQDKYGAANVVPGVMNEKKFEQFKGITPETMALFASVTGMDQDAAYQEYLKLAVPGRSALKRKIHRKGDNGEGIEGFSTDLPRVISSFVLSNARKSARDLYRGRIDEAVEAIPDHASGVKEQAIKLGQFVLEPDENDWSVGIRNMLFVWNMGGSIAFGVLNLSQPWMMTLPWLSQFSDPASAAGIMGKASKIAASAQMSGKAPKGYEAEYERAMREGIVDPQNVFMLQGVERGQSGVTANVWRNIAHGMGMIASATESMNRKLTLIAALDVARSKGDAWLKSKGFADAYDFAARAVAETQGIYNKGNRPAWARNPLGAVLMVFKQYAINWVEMAQRMAMNHYGDDKYRKGFWMLIGMLFMMAGGMGLPFAKDISDLIETGMSASGRPVNIERQMQMALGKDLYEPLMYGPANSFLLNPMGADMHGRMSMGNMIPATAALNSGMSKTARGDEAMEIFGAGAGLVSKFVDAYDQASAGNLGGAAVAASPRSVASIAKSVEMATSGKYTDSKGRTVRTVTPAEALIKGLDLQPASVARIQRERRLRFKDEAIQSQAKTEIRNDLIAAYESGDRKEIDAAEARLDEWNRNNPLYPVEINRRGLRKTIRERGKSWSARDEAPKGMEWMDEWIPEK